MWIIILNKLKENGSTRRIKVNYMFKVTEHDIKTAPKINAKLYKVLTLFYTN